MRKRIVGSRVLDTARAGALLLAFVAGFAPEAGAMSFNLEVRELTGFFTRNVYACDLTCLVTPAQHDAQTPPAGYELAPSRVMVIDSGSVTLFAPPVGVPDSLDLFPGIPGPEYIFVAQVLGVTILAVNSTTMEVQALAQVKRNTVFTYNAGSVVHEVTDNAGNVYILFNTTYEFAQTNDLSQEGAMAGTPLPGGWTYSSRTLTSDLHVDSHGEATVYVQQSLASWQLLVPEPAGLGLVAIGLLAAAASRRR